jgi:hypothetical protein
MTINNINIFDINMFNKRIVQTNFKDVSIILILIILGMFGNTKAN